MTKERIAIVDGIRTPFAKAGGALAKVTADELGAYPMRELMNRVSIDYEDIDQVVVGNVGPPAHAANIGRVVALKAGVPKQVPANSVCRNCASGMEALSTGINMILSGQDKVVLCGATESMSNYPLLFNAEMKAFFERLFRLKTPMQKIAHLFRFRLRFLKPEIAVLLGLTDPVCGILMGDTAENLVREFGISRVEQDEFALASHQKALNAIQEGVLAEEITPVLVGKDQFMSVDDGPRKEQSMPNLAKLRPYFDRKSGSVTVGNACPITDGAASALIMTESEAKRRGLSCLGFIRDYAYAGLDPHRMGLGPVYAASRVLDKTGLSMSEIDLVEINEAFASQVIANLKAFDSDEFAKTYLGRDQKLGGISEDQLNVNGGAIALGHPVGTSGMRIVLTLLKALKRSGKKRGLASLCVGGGQGGAFVVEAV